MVEEMAVVGFHVTVWADRVGVEGAAAAVDGAAGADPLADFDADGVAEGVRVRADAGCAEAAAEAVNGPAVGVGVGVGELTTTRFEFVPPWSGGIH